MLSRIGDSLSRAARRLVPDPFVLALGLSLLVLASGWVLVWFRRDLSCADTTWLVLSGWYDGFKNPDGLTFALQMCLVLVTGHALALSPPVQRIVRLISGWPGSTASASMLVAAVACVSAVVHWGLGAVVGALLAREIASKAADRGLKLHYPLLGAAAYAGLAVWHGGISGSAPLKVAEAGHFMENVAGVVPVAGTVLGHLNLVVTGTMLLLLPVLFWALAPRHPDGVIPPGPGQLSPPREAIAPREPGAIAWLHLSPWPGGLVGLGGIAFLIAAIAAGRLDFDLNAVNLGFLFLGILLHGRLLAYVEAVTEGARGAGAIVLQFPFYFGILGVMKASGLVAFVSEGFASVASAGTFPVLTFLSAGLVNLFVPSGGGQWAVQGEVLLRTGEALGVSPATTVMAFAYGDAWTNMLQPFWALPLLGIMGLRARDILGYTAVVFVALLLVVPLLLLLLA